MRLGKDSSSTTLFGITTNNIGHFIKEHAKMYQISSNGWYYE